MFKSHGFPPGASSRSGARSDNHPVVVVTWGEANDFCAKIGGRLPTEAEWERAARGGQEGVLYPWGDKAPTDAAGATNGAAFEGDAAQPVGQYAPNAFGVHDMAGNVWEWVSDWAGNYPADAVTDPKGSAVRTGAAGARRQLRRRPQQPARVEPHAQSARPREPQRRLPLRPRRALKPREPEAGSREPL